MRVFITIVLGATIGLLSVSPGTAETIYVVDQGVDTDAGVVAAKNHLAVLGYAVANGGPLSDYSSYAQVWDLRYNAYFQTADQTALGAYVTGGGRVYLAGENSIAFDSQNSTLISCVAAIGGGTLTKVYGSSDDENDSGFQPFTTEGLLLNTPNIFDSGVSYSTARIVDAPSSQGFLVTEDPDSLGDGSTVAWDFGHITGADEARMVVCFDINVFAPNNDWTQEDANDWIENVATFLGAPVPEPSVLVMGCVLLLFTLGAGRTRREAARRAG